MRSSSESCVCTVAANDDATDTASSNTGVEASTNVSSTRPWRTKNSSWYSRAGKPVVRPRAPVDSLERIARAIVAQREELLGVANRRRQRDAAGLVAARPRQRQRRQRIAAGEDHEGVRQLVWVQRAHEAEGVGTADAEAAKRRSPA